MSSAWRRVCDYGLTVETHCGIRELYADAQRWVADAGQVLDDGSDNPPTGIDNPFDTGTVTLQKPGIRIEWRSHGGRLFTFHPRTSADPPLQICH